MNKKTITTYVFSVFSILSFTEAGSANTTTYQYDSSNNVTAVDGPRADVPDVSVFTYYSNRKLKTSTNPLGHVTSYSNYNSYGSPGMVIDPNGIVSSISYDGLGRPSSIDLFDPVSEERRVTIYSYDLLGQLSSITFPNGQKTYFEYDDLHNIKAIENDLGDRIAYTLDAAARRTKEEYLGEVGVEKSTQYLYNELSQILKVVDGSGREMAYEYDANGSFVSSTDALQYRISRELDSLGRLVKNIAADGSETIYNYNEANKIASVVDSRGISTEYGYGEDGHLDSVDSKDAGVTEFEYDSAGNMVLKMDARGVRTEYSYDALNRLILTHIPASPELDIIYTYDEGPYAIGRISEIQDATGSTIFKYDPWGNVVEKSQIINGHEFVQNFTYDENNLLVGEIYPSGRHFVYDRNIVGNITSIQTTYQDIDSSVVQDISYLPFGPANYWKYNNGIETNKEFDGAYNLIKSEASSLSSKNYEYTGNGNIETIFDTLNIEASQSFSYDNRSRLVFSQGKYGSHSFEYDSVGNRLEFNDNQNNTSYIYDYSSNRLDASYGYEFIEYEYDEAGNIISDGSTRYIYDNNNRLSEVLDGEQSIAKYSYNSFGQRVIKQLENGTIVYFVYSLEGKLISEADQSGLVLREYAYLNEEPLALFSSELGSGNILDNNSANFSHSDGWVPSVVVSGFEAGDYLHHPPIEALSNAIIIDNDSPLFLLEGDWSSSEAIKGFEGNDYRHYYGPAITGGIIVDNTQGTSAGNWPSSTGVAGHEGLDYQLHEPGINADSFYWSAPSLSAEYEVYAKWTSHSNRATDAIYTVSHIGGDTQVVVNQQSNGQTWQHLGTYSLDETSNVALSGQGNGYVIADSIQFVPVSAPQASATWSLDTSGEKNIYVKWPSHINRASNVAYTINHSDGVSIVTVNQQEGNGKWYLLGTYELNQDSKVTLSGNANGYVIADAIALEPLNAGETSASWGSLTQNLTIATIYTKWTEHSNRAPDATYTIEHTSGTETVIFDQRQAGGEWHELGVFEIDENSKISLLASENGHAIADAIRIVAHESTEYNAYYYHNDHLGTPQLLTNNNKDVVWRGEYEPFGKITESVLDIDQPLRFPGQYHDKETGTYYNYFRDYDPSLGRYLQSDPMGIIGTPASVNIVREITVAEYDDSEVPLFPALNHLYGYANSNPLRYTDPYGLWPTSTCGPGHALCRYTELTKQGIAQAVKNSQTIAQGNKIRKVKDLCEKFGGKPKQWKKKKGWDDKGNEWHWYERNGQKYGWKKAGEADPF